VAIPAAQRGACLLKAGYVPVIDSPTAKQAWKAVCGNLGWPFRPDAWQARLGAQCRGRGKGSRAQDVETASRQAVLPSVAA